MDLSKTLVESAVIQMIPVICFLIFFNLFGHVFSDGSAEAKKFLIKSPDDVTVLLHGTAKFVCEFSKPPLSMYWTNGSTFYHQNEINERLRTSTIDTKSTLIIDNVQLEDSNEYWCDFKFENGSSQSRHSQLSVLVKPKPPVILGHQKSLDAKSNKLISVTCQSSAGKPASKIYWALEDEDELAWFVDDDTVLIKSNDFSHLKQTTRKGANITETSMQISLTKNSMDLNHRLSEVNSTLKLIPLADDDGKNLLCIVYHESYNGTFHTANVSLNVTHPPIVTVSVNDSSTLIEGYSALLECDAKAKPSNNLRFLWNTTSNDISVSNRQLFIKKLKREHNNKMFVCEVTNSLGTGRSELLLNVSYGPVFTKRSDLVVGELGNKTVLTCEADGNPPPAIVWRKNNNAKIIGTGKRLIFKHLTTEDRDLYICVATVYGFPPINQSIFLDIKSAPLISLTESPTSFGDSRELLCEAKSSQVPFTFCVAINACGTSSETIKFQKAMIFRGFLPVRIMLPLLIAVLSLIAILFCLCLLGCKRRLYKDSKRLSEEQSDVSVKCEQLDGGQFFADTYMPQMLDGRDFHFTKDYVSVPQGNPDLDYFEASPEIINAYLPRGNRIEEYGNSYGNYPINTSATGEPTFGMYGYNNINNLNTETSLLEQSAEMVPSDFVTAPGYAIGGNTFIGRPVSRLSTHV
uniref:Ig-like domain-containing protein n=1 Tax=Syphacia muris TaxID=451379 RepID=A0A158R5S6_9BILA